MVAPIAIDNVLYHAHHDEPLPNCGCTRCLARVNVNLQVLEIATIALSLSTSVWVQIYQRSC